MDPLAGITLFPQNRKIGQDVLKVLISHCGIRKHAGPQMTFADDSGPRAVGL